MQFRILGPLEVRRDGEAVALGGAKQRALLAILLLHANKALGVERLAELLWGDDPPTTASHVIEVYVSQLRRTLEPDGAPYHTLLTGPTGYRLRIDSSSLDTMQFEALVESAAQLRPEERLGQLKRALAMWRGPALAEFSTEPFAVGEVARLDELRLHTIEERIEIELALGRHAALIGELAALTSEHPLRERFCSQLMLALYRSGRQAEASDVYQRTRQRLADEVGMEPGPELQALLKRILQHDRTLNLHSERPPRSNLPARLTSFVGRRHELSQIAEAVAGDRLVTLVGVGGCGKTRLAIHAVEGLLDRFPDGVWFVDLAPLADAAVVPQAIADSLGIREQPRQPLLNTVIDDLRTKSALLLLDNCEHLIDGVATTTETLLTACRNIHVLATSRERLRIEGEQVYQLQPLAIPRAGAHVAPSELSFFESCELFIQRARQSRSSFSVSDENAQDIADLCRRLDGIPLAIELAAVQVFALTPHEVVTNMGSRFAILARGARTGLPKQRTLWATLDWSHQLLNESERTVFRRLSVFSGGFELEAAQDIAGDEGNSPQYVTTLVASLTDKSLVIADVEIGGATRYRLLETVRQFSTDLLDASGESDAVRDRHSTYYLTFAQHRQSLKQSDVLRWLPEFAGEEDNLRAALGRLWSRRPGDGLRLANLLTEFWVAAGRLKEGRSWFDTMLASEKISDKPLLSTAQYHAGTLAYLEGDYVAACSLIGESIELKRALGDARGLGQQLGLFATVTQRKGDGGRAIQLAEEGQAIALQLGDPLILARATLYLAWIVYFNGEFSRAKRLFLETVGPLRAARAYNGLGFALCGPLVIDAEQGDFESARRWAREVIEMVREHQVYLEPTGHMGVFVLLAEAEGRDDAASRLWGAALRMEREGRLIDATLRLKDQLATDGVRGRLGQERFDELLAEGAAMSLEELMTEALRDPERKQV